MLERRRYAAGIAKPIHSRAGFRRGGLVAWFDKHKVPARDTKKLGEDEFLVAAIWLERVDREYDVNRGCGERDAIEPPANNVIGSTHVRRDDCARTTTAKGRGRSREYAPAPFSE